MRAKRFFLALLLASIALVENARPQTPAPKHPRAGKAWENSLGMKFVPVPGTKVLFGVWDVRVMDYEKFVKDTGREWDHSDFPQSPTHPAFGMNWYDAKAFCEWLTKKERAADLLRSDQSYRLPTDAEWSIAVGLQHEHGNTREEKDRKIKNVYPWGKQWPPPKGAGNYADLTAKQQGSAFIWENKPQYIHG